LSLDGVSGLEQTLKQEVSGGLEPEKSEISEAEPVFIVTVWVWRKELSFEIWDWVLTALVG